MKNISARFYVLSTVFVCWFSQDSNASLVSRTFLGLNKVSEPYFMKSENEAANDYFKTESLSWAITQGAFYSLGSLSGIAFLGGAEVSFKQTGRFKPKKEEFSYSLKHLRVVSMVPNLMLQYELFAGLGLSLGGGVGLALNSLGPLEIEVDGVDGEKLTINLLEGGFNPSFCYQAYLGVDFPILENFLLGTRFSFYGGGVAKFGKNEFNESIIKLQKDGKIEPRIIPIPAQDRIDIRLNDNTKVSEIYLMGIDIGLTYLL